MRAPPLVRAALTLFHSGTILAAKLFSLLHYHSQWSWKTLNTRVRFKRQMWQNSVAPHVAGPSSCCYLHLLLLQGYLEDWHKTIVDNMYHLVKPTSRHIPSKLSQKSPTSKEPQVKGRRLLEDEIISRTSFHSN